MPSVLFALLHKRHERHGHQPLRCRRLVVTWRMMLSVVETQSSASSRLKIAIFQSSHSRARRDHPRPRVRRLVPPLMSGGWWSRVAPSSARASAYVMRARLCRCGRQRRAAAPAPPRVPPPRRRARSASPPLQLRVPVAAGERVPRQRPAAPASACARPGLRQPAGAAGATRST